MSGAGLVKPAPPCKRSVGDVAYFGSGAAPDATVVNLTPRARVDAPVHRGMQKEIRIRHVRDDPLEPAAPARAPFRWNAVAGLAGVSRNPWRQNAVPSLTSSHFPGKGCPHERASPCR